MPILFLPIAFGSDSAFDFQFHETYFVVSSVHLAIISTLFLGILGGIYWFLRKYNLKTTLSIFHAIGTSFSLIGIGLIAIIQTTYWTKDLELFRLLNLIGAIVILILIIVQIIFMANVINGLIKGKGKGI